MRAKCAGAADAEPERAGAQFAYPNDRDFTGLYERLRKAPCKQYVVIPTGSHVMHLEAARLALYAEVLRFLDRPD